MWKNQDSFFWEYFAEKRYTFKSKSAEHQFRKYALYSALGWKIRLNEIFQFLTKIAKKNTSNYSVKNF